MKTSCKCKCCGERASRFVFEVCFDCIKRAPAVRKAAQDVVEAVVLPDEGECLLSAEETSTLNQLLRVLDGETHK